ncbi:MAG: leucyl aminopeptidase family protein [Alphaproteobacteria bacterium]
MPHNLIPRPRKDTLTLTVLDSGRVDTWRKDLTPAQRAWLDQTGFSGRPGGWAILPSQKGGVKGAVFVTGADSDMWSWSTLATLLPKGSYRIAGRLSKAMANDAALGWGLAAYEFTRYRAARTSRPDLVWPADADQAAVRQMLDATTLLRDLINIPAEDLGPSELTGEARKVGRKYKARVRVIAGDALLKANYPMIHMVGRASDDAPRLIDMRWGTKGPLVTLVGKGVCFDTGGLDLKPAAGMLRMKKDMGGAAHALALGQLIMAAKLPVRLRVLIGAVENAVSGNAYRPWDVLQTRKGITVENANTDAEGRLVIGDCLAEASREKPDMLLDFATLTGAARVAVGAGMAAVFANDDKLYGDLEKHGAAASDPMWRLPLHKPYRALLDSKVADISSAGDGPFGGAITAALFLQEFVDDDVPWAHFDIMAWNTGDQPGRPTGGEAQGLRAAFGAIKARFGK